MKSNLFVVFLFLLFFCPYPYLSAQVVPERQWPAYRGYLSSGVLDNAGLPSTFSFEKMENVKWKVKIPGMGISSPVIWGNKLFLTTAISDADKAGFKPGIYGDGRYIALTRTLAG
jgi:outer membrane protein assembly factor BamB